MTISFSEIPADQLVPGPYLEINPRNPFAVGSIGRILLVGSPDATNTAGDRNRLFQVSSTAQAEALYGKGSALWQMVDAVIKNNPSANLWGYAISPSGSSTWSQAFTFSITASSQSGTISVRINGVETTIATSGTADEIAANVKSVLDTKDSDGITWTLSSNVLTATSTTPGTVGNNNRITMASTNSLISIAAATPTAGSGNIVFDATVLGDEQFDTVVLQDSGVALLDSVKNLMDSRWNAVGEQAKVYGHAWAARRASSTDHTTFLNGRNDEHATILCYEENSLVPEHIAIASYAAKLHQTLRADPALPATGLALSGFSVVEMPSQRFNTATRNSLLAAGGATIRYTEGETQVERAVTTASGANLPVWRDVQTPYTLMFSLRAVRSWMDTNYARVKIVDDGLALNAGARTVTPNIIRTDVIGIYEQLIDQGLMENREQFIANFVVQRNAQDRNRVDMNLPLNLANQLRVIAIQVNFSI